MKIKIDITQELLDNDVISVVDRAETCPVARAIRSLDYYEPRVGRYMISFNRNHKVYICKTPPKLKRFLRELDQGKKKKPTSFELEVQELT